jgi:hypothetical protein
MNLRRMIASAGALVCAALSVAPAHAYTQCDATLLSRLWAGDGGMIWIEMVGGGAAALRHDDPNREAVTAMAMTALASSRKVSIRYAADGADCKQFGRGDFVGMYLL